MILICVGASWEAARIKAKEFCPFGGKPLIVGKENTLKSYVIKTVQSLDVVENKLANDDIILYSETFSEDINIYIQLAHCLGLKYILFAGANLDNKCRKILESKWGKKFIYE
jgi:hypothetical protein